MWMDGWMGVTRGSAVECIDVQGIVDRKLLAAGG